MNMQGEETMVYQCVYPDVYYKVLPFAMMACDEMDARNYEMPSHEMIMQTSDRIYEDVCRVYPDLAERENYREMSYEAVSAYNLSDNAVDAQQFFPGGFFNDLVTIVLLNEFFGRRRRRRYY